ncbi:MAG: hypothetical protein E7107_03620 [Prevotella sp.]|nr:hypothetical protein [Prevotella sp.]
MSKRIGYIDAMRGFTMILVVYSHICGFCLGDRNIAFNDVLFLFRLPCFFFISGWLFQGTWGRMGQGTVGSIIKHKFRVQIVPTLIFLFFLSPPPAYFHQFGAFKGGYWFTFALFYFFVIYMLMSLPFRHRQGRRSDIVMLLLTLAISMSAYWYDINYHRLTLTCSESPVFQYVTALLGFLSYVVWRYYLFFFLGTLARKYFSHFLKIASNVKLMAIVVICFFAISQIPRSDIFLREYFKFSIGGILGMTMIFALFRYLYKSRFFSPLTSYLSPLVFVGTRTLDIYLLHYFFLPEFLRPHATQLLTTIPPQLLPIVVLLVALLVVVLCLVTSNLLRLSPFLARYLFWAM